MSFINITGLALAGFCFAGSVMANEAQVPCGADQMQELVGQSLTTNDNVFHDSARIIPPNSAVTQDFRPDRMNVNLDEDGVIIRIWCG
ncbi:MAG: hypothetical protein ACI9BH_000876 [Paracoccaceae bacterium]|jgi:hypothetical protein